MAIPKFQDFLYPFLLKLKDKDMTTREMKEALVQHFNLTDEDCAIRTQARYMIEYNVGVSTMQVYEVKRIDFDYFGE